MHDMQQGGETNKSGHAANDSDRRAALQRISPGGRDASTRLRK